VGANFKKAFYKAHLCRVLFKFIAVGDTIYADCYTICQTHSLFTLTFSLKMTFSTVRRRQKCRLYSFFTIFPKYAIIN